MKKNTDFVDQKDFGISYDTIDKAITDLARFGTTKTDKVGITEIDLAKFGPTC